MASRGCCLVLSAVAAFFPFSLSQALHPRAPRPSDELRLVRRLDGERVRPWVMTAFVAGAVDVEQWERRPNLPPADALASFDAGSGRVLVFDPRRAELSYFRLVAEGPPLRSGTVRLDAWALGVADPRGIAADPATGEILLIDGTSGGIVAVRSGRREGAALRMTAPGHGARQWSGLAADPKSGRFFTISLDAHALVVLDRAGGVIQTLPLPPMRLGNPIALFLAPSGDRTDDPAVSHLYVIDAGPPSALIELAIDAGQDTRTSRPYANSATLVSTIDTSSLSPPSPDPSGIAFRADTGRLVFVDGEVDEMGIWEGVNVWEIAPSGSVIDTASTLSFSKEPTDIAIDPSSGLWFMSDDGRRRIFVLDRGPDGKVGTGDDVRTWFSTSAFGSDDPEGLTFDTRRGRLILADGLNAEVYTIDPGVDGIFDGVSPAGDDVVTQFDTGALGYPDPEGVDYNADSDSLFIVSRGSREILETTTDGSVLREIDIGFLTELVAAAGIAYAPASNDPAVKSLYILDRAVDNNVDPGENDGRIYEVTIPPRPIPGSVADALIASGTDDAEERASGGMTLGSLYLDMVDDTSNQTVGLRFANVPIDHGARVDKAWVQFTTGKVTVGPVSLLLRGQASDDAPTFASVHRDISSRPRTAAAVAWEPDLWLAIDAAGLSQRTPDLTPVLQEIVDRPGWNRGNAIALIVTGNGLRTAHSFERAPSVAARLHVELIVPSCGDGVRQAGEECDGSDLGGETCLSRGFGGGVLECADDCSGFLETACSVCNANGTCDPAENCYLCPNECASSGPVCGNRICESGNGENCRTCPIDCAGSAVDGPTQRYCCGDSIDGGGIASLDSNCKTLGRTVSVFETASFCCGNGACEPGEDAAICGVDCAP